MYKVIITPLAHLDEENAYVWYEEKLKGLGDDFLTTLNMRITKFRKILAVSAL